MIFLIKMVGFIVVALVILFGAHFVLYQGIIYFFPEVVAQGRNSLIEVLIFLSVSFITASLIIHWHENPLTRLYYYLSGFWLGMLTNLILLLSAAWLLSLVTHIVGWELPRAVMGTLVSVVAFLVSVWGSYNAFHPRIREITVRIPGLPEAWRGKKVVQLTDVHLGAIYRAPWLTRVIAQTNSVHPEMVLITGDLFDGMDGHLDTLVEPLDEIEAPLGAYFITGNHETYLGLQEVFSALGKTKVHILDDAVVDVRGLKVIGLSYPERGTPTSVVLNTLEKLKPQYLGQPNILLFHSPTHIRDFAAAGINLQLAGHTHKGQMYPFGLITRLLYQGFDYGLYPMGAYTLYTSNGVGTWGPAMRIGNIPEIVSITLEKQ